MSTLSKRFVQIDRKEFEFSLCQNNSGKYVKILESSLNKDLERFSMVCIPVQDQSLDMIIEILSEIKREVSKNEQANPSPH